MVDLLNDYNTGKIIVTSLPDIAPAPGDNWGTQVVELSTDTTNTLSGDGTSVNKLLNKIYTDQTTVTGSGTASNPLKTTAKDWQKNRGSYDILENFTSNQNVGSLIEFTASAASGGNLGASFGELNADGVIQIRVPSSSNATQCLIANTNNIFNLKNCNLNRGLGLRIRNSSSDTVSDQMYFFGGYMNETTNQLSTHNRFCGFLLDPNNRSGLNPALSSNILIISKEGVTINRVTTSYSISLVNWHELYMVYVKSENKMKFYGGSDINNDLTLIGELTDAQLPTPELDGASKISFGMKISRGTANLGSGNRTVFVDYFRVFKDLN